MEKYVSTAEFEEVCHLPYISMYKMNSLQHVLKAFYSVFIKTE